MLTTIETGSQSFVLARMICGCSYQTHWPLRSPSGATCIVSDAIPCAAAGAVGRMAAKARKRTAKVPERIEQLSESDEPGRLRAIP